MNKLLLLLSIILIAQVLSTSDLENINSKYDNDLDSRLRKYDYKDKYGKIYKGWKHGEVRNYEKKFDKKEYKGYNKGDKYYVEKGNNYKYSDDDNRGNNWNQKYNRGNNWNQKYNRGNLYDRRRGNNYRYNSGIKCDKKYNRGNNWNHKYNRGNNWNKKYNREYDNNKLRY